MITINHKFLWDRQIISARSMLIWILGSSEKFEFEVHQRNAWWKLQKKTFFTRFLSTTNNFCKIDKTTGFDHLIYTEHRSVYFSSDSNGFPFNFFPKKWEENPSKFFCDLYLFYYKYHRFKFVMGSILSLLKQEMEISKPIIIPNVPTSISVLIQHWEKQHVLKLFQVTWRV